jgi:uncharacterized protein (TIGR02145 family)
LNCFWLLKQINMNKVIKLLAASLLTASLIVICGCRKVAEIPTLMTKDVNQITETTAVSGGMVYSIGDAEVTVRGVCWGTGRNPTTDDNKTYNGTGSGAYISNINGLMSNTTYHVRAYASSSAGTAYGDELSFTTGNYEPATIAMSDIGSFGSSYAVASVSIVSSGGAPVSDWGVCWNTAGNPTINDSRWNITGRMVKVRFTTVLAGLSPGTTYYARAYATNITGTSYGDLLSFTTLIEEPPINYNDGLVYGSVADIDGNHYKTIQTGSQTWMAENLRTTRFNDGEVIPVAEDNKSWSSLKTPGYCWYNNDPLTHKEIYGALYNWYAVNTGKLCPSGWHSPDTKEFNTLVKSINYELEGGKLKEVGVLHWAYPNSGASNEYGWTALPGGVRSADGNFNGLGFIGSWWYNVEPLPAANGRFAILDNSSTTLDFTGFESITEGISVRCIMDN